jgi:hypothetical protein
VLAAFAGAWSGPAEGWGATAESDSTAQPVIVWEKVTPLAGGRVADVAFSTPGLNIVEPVEMAWLLDVSAATLIAVASKPILGTAEAGEELGRRGAGLLRAPVAFFPAPAAQYVLEGDGRLLVLRSGWVDSLWTGTPPAGTAGDVAVGPGGLVYVLCGGEVHVYADGASTTPLLSIALAPKLLPAAAIALSARGDLVVAGTGQLALAVYAQDESGRFQLLRQRAARELGVERPGGVALTPALLLPYERREGWVTRDRFTILSDTASRRLLAFETATLEPLGTCDVSTEVAGASPARIDVSNRGQIAFVDAATGAAYALPARVLGRLIEGATIRWRTIVPDSAATSGGGSP